MLEILEKITKGLGTEKDLAELEHLANVIKDGSLCALGQSAPNPVLSTLAGFRDEYIAHVVDKKCPAGSCKELVNYEILPELCLGCGMCARNCPVSAIVKTDVPAKNPRLMAYKIDSSKCVKCGLCVSKCPAKPKAIIK
jgi:NADP-reducing hydrogenase subunit HndC